MPCIKEHGHAEKRTGSYRLHSFNHQPQGLSGMKRAGSTYLLWETCVDSKRLGQTFRNNVVSVPYKKISINISKLGGYSSITEKKTSLRFSFLQLSERTDKNVQGGQKMSRS